MCCVRQVLFTLCGSSTLSPLRSRMMYSFISDRVPDATIDESKHFTNNVAISVFFARSIATPRRLQTVTGVFEELPCFYIRSIGTQSTLQDITAACASAAYGIRHESAAALSIARSTYDASIAKLSREVALFPNSNAAVCCVLSSILCNFFEVIL